MGRARRTYTHGALYTNILQLSWISFNSFLLLCSSGLLHYTFTADGSATRCFFRICSPASICYHSVIWSSTCEYLNFFHPDPRYSRLDRCTHIAVCSNSPCNAGCSSHFLGDLAHWHGCCFCGQSYHGGGQ